MRGLVGESGSPSVPASAAESSRSDLRFLVGEEGMSWRILLCRLLTRSVPVWRGFSSLSGSSARRAGMAGTARASHLHRHWSRSPELWQLSSRAHWKPSNSCPVNNGTGRSSVTPTINGHSPFEDVTFCPVWAIWRVETAISRGSMRSWGCCGAAILTTCCSLAGSLCSTRIDHHPLHHLLGGDLIWL